MAFPKDFSRINTNLAPIELTEIIKAVEEDRVDWIPETVHLILETSGGQFDYRGARYELTEIREMVKSLNIIRSEQLELGLS